ncbi:type I-F CRISPR-associated endoribonuclease Cas6/Csy4 [Marinobacter oulmenensis]|uniref:CRISPR-associated endonuclease Csy4 n=1 Tax=Marinobacter oulmenensis TaxID=643747 RepID=A0A840U995_9GAMM|nr:type I-F CRISPR-associated endoribonuclease Cas6/Csy4 [Marinobacter oulmenensis]MBB5321552.1 CRISPR-associated endonuclease Csy4 [Marinobacter oulmenensis]
MNFYQDITLLSDSDIALGFLWQKLYQQVHIALVDKKIGENLSAVAVGFPEYGQRGFPLGRKLRLYAEEQSQLERVDVASYVERLSDYVHVKSIKPVPQATGYVSFRRYHAKGQARIEKDELNKAKRWAAKSGKPLEDCLLALEKTRPEPETGLPYIWMESQRAKKRDGSSARKFPLFINMEEHERAKHGELNCYGLSSPGAPVGLPVF